MSVAALLLLVLGIPLAIAVHQSIFDSEVVELQAVAARTLAEIRVPLDVTQLTRLHTEADAPPPFGVYDTAGHLMFGDGPAAADPPTRRALTGSTVSATDGQIVVGTPIIDDATEKVVGALRLSESLDDANHRARIAWLIMGASGLAALAIGWLIATRLARRLVRPVSDLAGAASRLGDGGPLEPTRISGITEIDTLASALTNSAQRVNDALARERRFSADVSHQLRTPLTGLRLRLEAARDVESPAALDGAFDDLTRIDATVAHLLAFARDELPARSSVRLDAVAHDASRRWAGRVEAQHRRITVTANEPLTAQGTSASVAQILDVLIDNALRHGRGDIAVAQRQLSGGAALDVSDDGTDLTAARAEHIFRRGEGAGTGIGLALARSLAQSDGGRLVLSHQHPTTFSLILLAEHDAPQT